MTTMNRFAAALLTTTLLAAPAIAQSQQPAQPPSQAQQPAQPPSQAQQPAQAQPPAQSQQQPMAQDRQSTAEKVPEQTTLRAGQWRGSKLIGLNVRNPQNENIGDISDLIVNQQGEIDAVVVGVGGFLGIGQHDVALSWEQIKFVHEADRTASAPTARGAPSGTARTDTGAATTGAATTGAGTAGGMVREVPDHAVVNMTKDQLKDLPAFRYSAAN